MLRNHLVIIGNLTQDPVLKHVGENRSSFLQFCVAVTRRKVKGEEQKPDYIYCKAWRTTAEQIAQYFRKGSLIGIIGELRSDCYEKDGEWHSIMNVDVTNFEFIPSNKPGNRAADADPQSNAAPMAAQDDDALPY